MTNLDNVVNKGADAFRSAPLSLLFSVIMILALLGYGWSSHNDREFVNNLVTTSLTDFEALLDEIHEITQSLDTAEQEQLRRWLDFRDNQVEFRDEVFSASNKNMAEINARLDEQFKILNTRLDQAIGLLAEIERRQQPVHTE